MTGQRLRQILVGNATASADEMQAVQELIEFCEACGSRFGATDSTVATMFDSVAVEESDSTSNPKIQFNGNQT